MKTMMGLGMSLVGFSKEKEHADLEVNSRTYTDDPHDIVIDDIGSTKLTDGDTDVYGSDISVEFGVTDQCLWDRAKANAMVAKIIGWEITAEPDDTLDFKSQLGLDRGITPGGGLTKVVFTQDNITGWIQPHQKNQLLKCTKVLVLGASEGTFQSYGSSGVGSNIKKFDLKNLINNDTCGKMAAAIYADLQNDLYRGAFECVDTYEGRAFDIFDTIYVADEDYGIASDYRVYRLEKEVIFGESHPSEITKIYYTDVAKLLTNGPLALDGTWYLRSGQFALENVGRSRLNIINEDSLDGSTGNVDLGASGLVGDLDDVDDGTTYGKVSRTGLSSGLVGADSCQSGLGMVAAASRDSYDKNVSYIETNSTSYVEAYLLENMIVPSGTKIELNGSGFEYSVDGGCYVKFSRKFGEGSFTLWSEHYNTGSDIATFLGSSYHLEIGNGTQSGYGDTVQIKIEIKVADSGDTMRIRNPFVDTVDYQKREDL